MADLANQLNKNKKLLTRGPGGVLQEDTVEEVQSLANKAGVAPPTTALGTGLLGGSADQQKMAGTPAQVTSSVRQSLAPSASLADATRRGQARTQLTAEEQQKQQQAGKLEGLGGLGDRVSGLIDAQRAKLQQAEPVQVGAAAETTAAGTTTNLADLKPLLAQLRANPNDPNLQLQVNQALGRNINSVIGPDEINSLYQSSVQAISGGAAANIDDKLTVADLASTPEGLGSTTAELSQLLNVPEAQLQNYSVTQFKQAIEAARQAEFTKSQQLQQQATSGLAGQAERSQARELGREASATGVRSIEQGVQHLEDQIQNADQVKFGGKSYNVDDLLSDATISGIVTDYMNSAPDSPERKQLESTEPGLIDFIKKNEVILGEAAKQLSAGAQTFQDIQSYNQELTQGLETLPPEVLKTLAPGVGELSAAKLTGSESPLLKELVSTAGDPQARQNVIQSANTVFGEFPELADLSGVDPGAFSDMMRNPQKAQNEVNKYKEINRLLSLGSSQELASALTGGRQGPKQIEEAVRENAINKAIGFGAEDAVNRFDSNGDGQIDSLDIIQNNSSVQKPTAQMFFTGNTATPRVQEAISKDLSSLSAPARNLRAVLGPAAADGKLEPGEIEGPYSVESMKSAPFADSLNRAAELQELAKVLKGPPETVNAVQGKLQTVREDNTKKAFDQFSPQINAAIFGNPKMNSVTLGGVTRQVADKDSPVIEAVNSLENILSRAGSGQLSPNLQQQVGEKLRQVAEGALRMRGFNSVSSEDVLKFLKTGQVTGVINGNKITNSTIPNDPGLLKLKESAKKFGLV